MDSELTFSVERHGNHDLLGRCRPKDMVAVGRFLRQMTKSKGLADDDVVMVVGMVPAVGEFWVTFQWTGAVLELRKALSEEAS